MITDKTPIDINRWLSQKKPFLFIDEVVEIKYPIIDKKRKDIVPKDLLGTEVVCKFFTDEKKKAEEQKKESNSRTSTSITFG